MPLRGTIQGFPIPDLLQFLASGQSTGVLHVYEDEDTKHVAFREGEIVFITYQKPVPQLDELIRHGDVSAPSNSKSANRAPQWDQVITRALVRRRLVPYQRSGDSRRALKRLMTDSEAELATFLLAQGRLTNETLGELLQPEAIPDRILEEILVRRGLVREHELEALTTEISDRIPLHQLLIDLGVLQRSDLQWAVINAPDDLLAELVVEKGILTSKECRAMIAQLECFRGQQKPTVRLGEYLVATGQTSPREFQRSLVEQIHRDERLGEILVERGYISRQEVLKAVEEIENLRTDFGPLHALRRELVDRGLVERSDFDMALKRCRHSGRLLNVALESDLSVDREELEKAALEVVTREICDLLLWSRASFRFEHSLTLDDVLAPEDFAPIEFGPFPTPMLLLEAHSRVDESQLADRTWNPLIVLTSVDSLDDVEDDSQRSFLSRFDGRRSLQAVLQYLPGNRFVHFCRLQDAFHSGQLRPLGREESSKRGVELADAGQHSEALTLFRQALLSKGKTPPDEEIKERIQNEIHAHRGPGRNVLVSIVRYLTRLLTGETDDRQLKRWERRSGEARREYQYAVDLDEILIRSPFLRALWTFQRKLLRPLEWIVPRQLVISRPIILLALAVSLVVFWRTTRDDPNPVAEAAGSGAAESPTSSPDRQDPRIAESSTPSLVKSSTPSLVRLTEYEIDGPVEVAPAIDGRRVYVASRDGSLRCVQMVEAASREPTLAEIWSVKIGEFGDILSPPVLVDGEIVVTNVRGPVTRVSSGGAPRWKIRLPKISPAPVGVLRDASGKTVGLAVTTEEGGFLLSPTSGETLLRFLPDVFLTVRVVSDDRALYCAGQEGVAYRVSLQGKTEWKYEMKETPSATAIGGRVFCVGTQDGTVYGLKTSNGELRWQRKYRGRSVVSLRFLGSRRIAVGLKDGDIEILSLEGREPALIARFDTARDLGIGGHFEDRLVFLTRDSGVVLASADGNLLGKTDADPATTGWGWDGEVLAISNQRGKLELYHTKQRPRTGEAATRPEATKD